MNKKIGPSALFRAFYKQKEDCLFISYGRLEILGNHTDHNNGLCLVSTASMGIKAAIKKRDDKIISIKSDGYDCFSFALDDISPLEKEKFTSIALTKGVVSKIKELGYKVGGFSAALTSDIFQGAGVSSSACYEILIGAIINYLYNDNKISRIELAKIGQYAENVYFGKPCGLLDQMGSALGGITFLDFKDVEKPIVENMVWPEEWDLHIVLVNPGLSHAKLSHLYASIPLDMKTVAVSYGKNVLRELDENEVLPTLDEHKELTLLQKNRARHYFGENRRVLLAKEAIQNKDKETFLSLVKETAKSCKELLKNTYVEGSFEYSPQEALDYASNYIGSGAARSMGGGFAGSIICFVDGKDVETFKAKMMEKYGKKSTVEVNIPPLGAHKIEK